ncbi:hypothetical protein [Burkholderia territorii]|uniref:hypothetical protein n=1 Tax=Burkholderia territorii TaxID=1503055 RepID=UPI001BA8FBB2|nr:hypothetical protein [Burkholderia territorii]
MLTEAGAEKLPKSGVVDIRKSADNARIQRDAFAGNLPRLRERAGITRRWVHQR